MAIQTKWDCQRYIINKGRFSIEGLNFFFFFHLVIEMKLAFTSRYDFNLLSCFPTAYYSTHLSFFVFRFVFVFIQFEMIPLF